MYQLKNVAVPTNTGDVLRLQGWLDKCEAAGAKLVCFMPTATTTAQVAVFHADRAEALAAVEDWDTGHDQ